jgi:hypothetical protein
MAASGKKRAESPFYRVLRAPVHRYDERELIKLFAQTDEKRVEKIALAIGNYLRTNLPEAIEKRAGLADYRTNPYVLLTSASVMKLLEPAHFADFLFNTKLYMALETSFGKSLESAMVEQYPIGQPNCWATPPEKVAEFEALSGLSQEAKAQERLNSIWREIDKSAVIGKKRFLVSIKSGPNTINDTQVQAMTDAIVRRHATWAAQTRKTYPAVRELDVVVGLTYGTDRITNNKENQILAKLLTMGFVEEDPKSCPGVLIDSKTRTVRVYRRIGVDYWSFIGNPLDHDTARHVFLEILLGLAKALTTSLKGADLETRINAKLDQLAAALRKLKFPRATLPKWVRDHFSEDELFWFATGMTAFFDEGI